MWFSMPHRYRRRRTRPWRVTESERNDGSRAGDAHSRHTEPKCMRTYIQDTVTRKASYIILPARTDRIFPRARLPFLRRHRTIHLFAGCERCCTCCTSCSGTLEMLRRGLVLTVHSLHSLRLYISTTAVYIFYRRGLKA